MAVWQIMIGFGIGMIATVVTIIMNSRTNRSIKQDVAGQHVASPEDQCVICLEPMSNVQMKYLLCGHALHQKCLDGLRRHQISFCPTCRQQI